MVGTAGPGAQAPKQRLNPPPYPQAPNGQNPPVSRRVLMVGTTGIEPVTPSMSTRCSPAELRARLLVSGWAFYPPKAVLARQAIGGYSVGPCFRLHQVAGRPFRQPGRKDI